MSVLIRGMQMPKNCGVCPLRGCGYLCCPDTENERLIRTEYMCSDDLKRPDWCPLVDLGSHGDLIDKDVLLDDLLIHADSYFADFARLWTNKQPAVIEAEGAEE